MGDAVVEMRAATEDAFPMAKTGKPSGTPIRSALEVLAILCLCIETTTVHKGDEHHACGSLAPTHRSIKPRKGGAQLDSDFIAQLEEVDASGAVIPLPSEVAVVEPCFDFGSVHSCVSHDYSLEVAKGEFGSGARDLVVAAARPASVSVVADPALLSTGILGFRKCFGFFVSHDPSFGSIPIRDRGYSFGHAGVTFSCQGYLPLWMNSRS